MIPFELIVPHGVGMAGFVDNGGENDVFPRTVAETNTLIFQPPTRDRRGYMMATNATRRAFHKF